MNELRCLLDRPGLRVSSDEDNEWLYLEWRGVHDVASVQQHTDLICACHRAWPYRKILSDHSALVGSWQHSVPWIGGTYLTSLAAQGVTYFAWVYNAGYQDRASMEQALFYATAPAIALFADLAAACQWLQRSPPGVLGRRRPLWGTPSENQDEDGDTPKAAEQA
jgi:hypothetical protein